MVNGRIKTKISQNVLIYMTRSLGKENVIQRKNLETLYQPIGDYLTSMNDFVDKGRLLSYLTPSAIRLINRDMTAVCFDVTSIP